MTTRTLMLAPLLSLTLLAVACEGGSGYGDPGTEPALTEAPADPTYTEDVSRILDQHCAGCHTDPPSGGAPAAVLLDRYDGASANAERIVSRAVDGDPGSMPPGGLVLSDAEAETLVRWAELGAPE